MPVLLFSPRLFSLRHCNVDDSGVVLGCLCVYCSLVFVFEKCACPSGGNNTPVLIFLPYQNDASGVFPPLFSTPVCIRQPNVICARHERDMNMPRLARDMLPPRTPMVSLGEEKFLCRSEIQAVDMCMACMTCQPSCYHHSCYGRQSVIKCI